MKKLAIIAVILVGGGIFAGYMAETNSHVEKPKVTVAKTTSIKEVPSQQVEDIKNTNKISSQKINSQTLNDQKVSKVENTGEGTNTTKPTEEAPKVQKSKANIVNDSNSSDSTKVNNTEVTHKEVISQNIKNENSNNKPIVEGHNSQNISSKNQVQSNSNETSNVNKGSINNDTKKSTIINNSNEASNLVKQYYKNKYPSINQSNWSTDVSENQTIAGKTGYVVRLYNYMNNHSNNIAWILVTANGMMYSTEAGSEPIIKLN